ncbi:MAG: PorT family protein [Bacteroidales bacterium]|jgi:hypothetical protein|nr:PorT family protein [Bacteroidales bacterium]
MKKILPFIIMLIVSAQSLAQYKPVLFGLRAGGNLGWIKPDTEDYASEGVVPGFTWGFIAEFFVMENYAVLTGFNMQFNGGKLEYPTVMDVEAGDSLVTVPGSLSRRYSLKYIQIPLCLKMQTEVSEKIKVFGKIGIGTAFRLNARAIDDFDYEGGNVSVEKHNIDDDISLMRESLILGGGVEWKLKGSTALIFEVTYDNAFNDMLNSDNPAMPGTNPKAVQNFVELGGGIVF